MVVKVKEYFEKTRYIKNNDKSKKYILRGRSNTKNQERILSNTNKFYNLTNFSNLYMFKVCQHYRFCHFSRKW